MQSSSLRDAETRGSHAIALKDAIPAAWEMDGIQAEHQTSSILKQHNSISLQRGRNRCFYISPSFLPMRNMDVKWNIQPYCLIYLLHYPAVSPRQFKDRSSPFRTYPLGVRQPICFLPHKQGRFVWALQYVLLEGFQHAEFLSRDRADKPWGNKVVGLWNDEFARHPFLKWVNKMLLIFKLMAGPRVTLSQTVSNIPVRRRWVTVAISPKHVSVLVLQD